MDQFWAEFTHDNMLSLPVVLARMLLATLLGAVIGLEREWRKRPAGLKTHMMVCLASATFTIVSLELVNVPVFDDHNIRMDPSRLVEAITSGVAFLAAGFIIFAKGQITGITTHVASCSYRSRKRPRIVAHRDYGNGHRRYHADRGWKDGTIGKARQRRLERIPKSV